MKFQLSHFISKEIMLLKYCTQYAGKLGKLSTGTRLEKFNFHSNPKEGKCQRMFKLLYNGAHFKC